MFSLQIVFVALLAYHLVQARPQPDGSTSGDGQQFKTPAQIPCSIRQEFRTTIVNLMSDPTTTVKTFYDTIMALLRKYPETTEGAAKMEEFRNEMKKLRTAVESCYMDSVKDNPTTTGEATTLFGKLESDDSTFSDKCNAHYEFMHLIHSVADKKSLHECIRSKMADGGNNNMMFKGGPGMIPSSSNSASFGKPFPGDAFGGLGPMAMSGPPGLGGMAMGGSPSAAPGAGAPAASGAIASADITDLRNIANALQTTLRAGGNGCDLAQQFIQKLRNLLQEHPGQCPATTDSSNAASAPAMGAPAS